LCVAYLEAAGSLNGHSSPAGRRNVKEKTMYEEGFDVQAVRKRLKTEYAVEQTLPLNIAALAATSAPA
jgi:hypothetical protein